MTILGGNFTPDICILRSQSFIFFIKWMILSKNPKLRHTLPLFWGGSQNHGSPLQTNKQTIFFKFKISKSFQLWYPIIDAITNKICHAKHYETIRFCFFALIIYFFHKIIDFDEKSQNKVFSHHFFWGGSQNPVSYTHLTLPTKRIV